MQTRGADPSQLLYCNQRLKIPYTDTLLKEDGRNPVLSLPEPYLFVAVVVECFVRPTLLTVSVHAPEYGEWLRNGRVQNKQIEMAMATCGDPGPC